MRLYLAHSISHSSYSDVMKYYRSIQTQLRDHYYLLCPMVAKGCLASDSSLRPDGYKDPTTTGHAIIERDYWMLASSDIVLVDLSGATGVSIGCMMELAWAYQLRKHTVVVVPKNDVYRHAFVREAADTMFTELSEAISYLIELTKEI